MSGSGGALGPSGRTFETHRIAVLQGEREKVQKKTFTKWCNSHLAKVSIRVSDLYTDLCDGRVLLKLLEVLSGDKWAKPSRGTMRFHQLENNEKVFSYLKHAKIKVENMGPEDIVDGNQRLILGLIWTIILRFQIQDITFETEDDEKKSAKEALMLWTQRRTKGYRNVKVTNFTSSWRDGLAFASLIHKHRPDLIDFDSMSRDTAKENLETTFNVAEEKLGIPKLLDVEDVNVDYPDEKSIMTYVANYYHTFAKMKTGDVSSKRIVKMISFLQECESSQHEYNRLASSLLEWIHQTIDTLGSRDFPNMLTGVQSLLADFARYRTEEKPPKYTEKGNLEVLFYNLNAKLRSQSQPGFVPEDGKLIGDIAESWTLLEQAEHAREVALREELMRLERLERMAEKFDKKAGMRANWLIENHKLVSQDNFGVGIAAVEAAKKKHEAIQTDIKAYESRVKTVVDMANTLENELYWGIDRIKEDLDKILELWEVLLHALVGRRQRLDLVYSYTKALQDVNDLVEYLRDLKVQLQSTDYGRHLGDVDSLLQKQTLLESEYVATQPRIAASLDVPDNLLQMKGDEEVSLVDSCETLRNLVAQVDELLKKRREKLESSQHLHKFYEDVDNEDEWIGEKMKILSAAQLGSDLPTASSLLKHHELFDMEVNSHRDIVKQVCDLGQELIESDNFDSDNMQLRIQQLQEHYEKLVQLCKQRQLRLLEVVAFQTYLSDTDEILNWLSDMEKIVQTEDLGKDEASAQLLLKKHKALEEEISGYEPMISGLKKQQDNLSSQDRLLPVTRERQDSIEKKYSQILQLAKQRRQYLVFAYSMFLLYREAGGVRSWIQEKEALLCTIKAPEEYADADVVERRFESFLPELETYEYRIEEVTDLGQQLISKAHPKSEEIEDIIREIARLWDVLNDHVEDKRIELISTISLQQFKNSIQYCVNWINCKAKALLAIQSGDVTNIETKIRTVDLIEKELLLLQDKVGQLNNEVDKHNRLTPEERQEISESVQKVSQQWDELNNLLDEKKNQLENTSKLRTYITDLDSFLLWQDEILTQHVLRLILYPQVESRELDVGIARVDLLIKHHNDTRAEIDTFKPKYQTLLDDGKELSRDHVSGSPPLGDKLSSLTDKWENIEQNWDGRAKLLNQCRALQMFKRDVRLAENTLNKQDEIISQMKSPEHSPEVRIKKLNTFEKLTVLAETKLDTLKVTAKTLIEDDHYASEEIREIMNSLQSRHAENLASAEEAEDAIKEAKRLQKFLDDSGELTQWLKENADSLGEESLRDPGTYPALMKRHDALRSELTNNEPHLEKIKAEDINDITENPMVMSNIEELQKAWDDLNDLLEEKEKELEKAEKARKAEEKLQDLKVLVADLDAALASPDSGADPSSAKQIAKKYDMIAEELDGLDLICEEIPEVEADSGESVNAQKDDIKSRFAALQVPLEKKKKKVDEKENLREFNKLAGDEEQYLKEKQIALDNNNLGQTLMEAEMLLSKHQAFVGDLEKHTPTFQATMDYGKELQNADHYGSNIIEARLKQLKAQWDDILQKSEARNKDLEENNLTQKFYFECTEAESYLKEIAHLITTDTPADEASAETMLTKHKTVQASIEDHKERINNLKDMLDSLNEHPLMARFNNRYEYIHEAYEKLDEKAKKRRKVLEDSYNLFHFNREVAELNVYISSKEIVANSNDLGRDYEHVQVLENKFNEFYTELTTIGQGRVDELFVGGDSLLENNHTMSPDIQNAMQGMQEKWTNLLNLAASRKATLASSVELHKYHRDVNVLISRIQAADASIPSDLGRDVSTVQALQRKHQSMTHDIQAIRSQVEGLDKENQRLQELYPGARARGVTERQGQLETSWSRLQDHLNLRKEALISSTELFTFLRAANQLIQWATNMRKLFVSDEIGTNVSAVDLQILQHRDLKCEMDTRVSNREECDKLGNDLLTKDQFVDVVSEKLDQVSVIWDSLYSDWDETLEELDIMLEAHTFARDAKSANTWITNQSGNLTDPPETATLDHIEALLKKFENFERAINAQADRFDAFKNRTRYEEKSGAGRRKEALKKIETEEEDRSKSDNDLAIEIARQLQGKASQWKRRSEVLREQQDWLLAAEEENLKVGVLSIPEVNGVEEETENKEIESEEKKKEEEEDSIKADGTLQRKIIARRTGDLKNLDKTWVSSHVVIKKGSLVIYKDEKSLKEDLPQFEEPILHCTVEHEPKQKKKHVFKFTSIIGTTYLFQATSQSEMDNWIAKIREVRDFEDSQVKHEYSLPDKPQEGVPDNADKDNTIASVVSDKISEAGSVEKNSRPEKKKSKSLKKKRPSIFKKKKEKIDE
ncbi:hypothetical protein ACHWQZ_G001266 [Mnemiopsis leidyi]